jgi:dephospho-CoA kinase
MKHIGLTGGIASGKSTVSAILRELGVPIVDADKTARELSKKGNKVWQAVRENFGSSYFLPDGEMDRKALGDLIFSNSEARERLNRVTHPIIQKEMESKMQQIEDNQDVPLAVMDVPLLFESGWQTFMDEVWVVSIPEEMQISRLMKRDRLTREQALLRINSQISLKEKCKMADRVIDNSGSLEQTKEQIVSILKEFKFWRI